MNSIEEIKKEVEKFFSNARGSHDWEHTERVYNLCMRIGEKENADLEILKLSALLHDIGREEENKANGKICHAEKGAMLAKEILEKHNIEKGKVDKIIYCIANHRFRGSKNPQSKEAQILFDADKLDAIGATGIGRAFLFAGEIGSKLHNKNIEIGETEAYSKEDTAYREFTVKLKKIKDRIITEEGKRIAKERHKFMVDFFDRLNDEVDGKL